MGRPKIGAVDPEHPPRGAGCRNPDGSWARPRLSALFIELSLVQSKRATSFRDDLDQRIDLMPPGMSMITSHPIFGVGAAGGFVDHLGEVFWTASMSFPVYWIIYVLAGLRAGAGVSDASTASMAEGIGRVTVVPTELCVRKGEAS
jgi:threonine/homoserine efflux transporter RhtA